MVGKLKRDERGWCLIHEEVAGPYVWVTPFRLASDQAFPEDWKDGDEIEFNLNTPYLNTITLTDDSYKQLIIEIV